MEAKRHVSGQNFQDQLLSTKLLCTRGTGALDKGQRQEELEGEKREGNKEEGRKETTEGKEYFSRSASRWRGGDICDP